MENQMPKKNSNLVSRTVIPPPAIQKQLDTHGIKIAVGDTVLDRRDGDTHLVTAIRKTGIELSDYLDFNDGKGERLSQYGVIEFNRFHNNFYTLDKPIEDYERDLLAALVNPAGLELKEELPTDETSTALVVQRSEKNVLQLRDRMQAMEKQVGIMTSVLERKKNEMMNVLHHYQEAVAQVSKVIHTLELYLGINEDIVQLADGPAAAESEPISIRQQVLFMDEEFGDAEDDGLDAMRLEEFDTWLASDARNYNRVLPEARGVICLRVRRKEKEYVKDPLANALMNQGNHMAYILIRNGLKFYRIWADVDMGTRFFPRQDELDPEKDEHSWDAKDRKERAFSYKQKTMLLQGLIDRTEVFNPKPAGVNLFHPGSYGQAIRLIADDERTLPSGRLSFWDWQAATNAKIERGTRILWVSSGYSRYHGDSNGSFSIYYRKGCEPPSPTTGVYSVDCMGRSVYDHKTDKRIPDMTQGKIVYNPKDVIYDNSWSSWRYRKPEHERLRGVGIWFNINSRHILNYDLLSLEDVEFYLESRVDRPNYLDMMPILRNIKKMRLKELDFERQFVHAQAERLAIVSEIQLSVTEIEKRVWSAVEWWKTKVIWKRPLTEDDSKAWRMIRRRVLKGDQ
jgi:hypothetical protein